MTGWCENSVLRGRKSVFSLGETRILPVLARRWLVSDRCLERSRETVEHDGGQLPVYSVASVRKLRGGTEFRAR